MSAVSSLFHIVINTLRRELTIPDVVFKVPLRGTFDLLHTTKLRGPSALNVGSSDDAYRHRELHFVQHSLHHLPEPFGVA